MKDAVWLNKYFRLALEASPNGQLIVDKNGVIRHVNEKITDIFGYTSRELKGSKLELLVPDGLKHVHINYRDQYYKIPSVRNMGTGQILYGRDKTGQEIPIEVGLVPLVEHGDGYVLATVVDITERLKSEQRFQLTLEASPSGLILIDDAGKIELINSKIEEIFGYLREELIGLNIDMLVPESYRKQHPSYIKQFLAKPKVRSMGAGRDLYGQHKNGTEVPVEIGLNPLEIDGRIYVLASVVDTTERNKAEKEKQLLNDQIQNTQRMESLGILAGGTAHDFNNILSAISGNAELIELSLPAELNNREKISQYLSNIVRSCKRAGDLTNQMLAYAGKANILKEDIIINDIVKDMHGLLDSIIPKIINLDIRLGPGMQCIDVDQSQIQQVLLNLVTNAAEAIGDSPGEIVITTGSALFTRSELIRYKMLDRIEEGEYQFLNVRDTGAGMSTEVINNIFDPFFTTKFTGRGLGMASVLGIIRGHHGGIQVTSELNKGSTINVIFPVKPASSDTYELRRKNKKHILIIDDEKDIRDIISNMLILNGFDVTSVSTAENALSVIKSGHAAFDLIVLDMNLPGMSGFEMYDELMNIRSQVKMIMVSGYSGKQVNSLIVHDAESGNHSISAFLHKPFEYKKLLSEIERALVQSEQH